MKYDDWYEQQSKLAEIDVIARMAWNAAKEDKGSDPLTKREAFAMAAMQADMSTHDNWVEDRYIGNCVAYYYKMADAMIEGGK